MASGWTRCTVGDRAAALAAALLLAGCGGAEPAASPRADASAFAYHGRTLRFAPGTLDALTADYPPYARLMPRVDYLIDLGRLETGKTGPSGLQLGFGFYTGDAERIDLGEGHVVYCDPPDKRVPAFYCAALLHSLPYAAVQFRARPGSIGEARAIVADAEARLTAAIIRR